MFLPSFLASLLVSGRGVTLSCLSPLSPNPPPQGASGPSAPPQACLLEMLPVPSQRPALVGLGSLLFTHCSPMRTEDTLSCPSQPGHCLCPLGPSLMLLVPQGSSVLLGRQSSPFGLKLCAPRVYSILGRVTCLWWVQLMLGPSPGAGRCEVTVVILSTEPKACD